MKRTDASDSRFKLKEICEKYRKTVGHQSDKTFERKNPHARPLACLIGGTPMLATFNLGTLSFNLSFGFRRELFCLALDRMISVSPVSGPEPENAQNQSATPRLSMQVSPIRLIMVPCAKEFYCEKPGWLASIGSSVLIIQLCRFSRSFWSVPEYRESWAKLLASCVSK